MSKQSNTKSITIEVPEETAEAYESASEEKREDIKQTLAFSLMSRKQAAQEFERIANKMSKQARERGLTEEGLEKLLADE